LLGLLAVPLVVL